jgi:hypothetical protein
VDVEVIRSMIDELSGITEDVAKIGEKKEVIYQSSLTPDDKATIEKIMQLKREIDDEFKNEVAALAEKTNYLRVKIQDAVLENKASVKGHDLIAVYVPPKQTVNVERFLGFAADHPEVMPFVKEGKPSVTIRKNTESK